MKNKSHFYQNLLVIGVLALLFAGVGVVISCNMWNVYTGAYQENNP